MASLDLVTDSVRDRIGVMFDMPSVVPSLIVYVTVHCCVVCDLTRGSLLLVHDISNKTPGLEGGVGVSRGRRKTNGITDSFVSSCHIPENAMNAQHMITDNFEIK